MFAAAPALAQEGAVQPAHNAQERAEQQREAQPGQQSPEHDAGAIYEHSHLRSWEAPEIVVEAKRPLEEEQLIGEYAQPRWTVPRRFPTARIYVVPAGTVQLDWTLDAHMP